MSDIWSGGLQPRRDSSRGLAYNIFVVETIVTITFVTAAAAYLVWTYVRIARGAGGCGNCGCGSSLKRDSNLGTQREIISVNLPSSGKNE